LDSSKKLVPIARYHERDFGLGALFTVPTAIPSIVHVSTTCLSILDFASRIRPPQAPRGTNKSRWSHFLLRRCHEAEARSGSLIH
jgi:hypothetical protein